MPIVDRVTIPTTSIETVGPTNDIAFNKEIGKESCNSWYVEHNLSFLFKIFFFKSSICFFMWMKLQIIGIEF